MISAIIESGTRATLPAIDWAWVVVEGVLLGLFALFAFGLFVHQRGRR